MKKRTKIIIGIIIGIALVFCCGSFAIDRHILNETYARHTPEAPTLLLTDADIAASHPYSDASFELDGRTLKGHVYAPAQEARGLVVFRHGIRSQHQDYLALITALVDRGWKVFAYDAIGCGESDGDSIIGFAQAPRDVHAAVEYVRKSGIADSLPVLLVGHSWGAYGVASSLAFGDDIAGRIAMSGFDTPQGIIMEATGSLVGPFAVTQAPFVSLIGWLDFGDAANRSAVDGINSASVPVLVMHGTQDQVIGFDGASIMAARNRITNRAAQFIVKDEEARNGHNSYFYSKESNEYLAQKTGQLQKLNDEYTGKIPENVLDEFLAGVDKIQANTADPVLIDEMDAFLGECVSKR